MMIRYFFTLFFVLCSLSCAQATTRWVCTPSLCPNNGNGNSNSCAASPGGTGCFDGITNLNLSGLGGGDIVNLYNGANCNAGNDGFSGTVNIGTGGTAGNNLVIQSDPATCGTPTFGFTPTSYQFTGSNIKFDLPSGISYVTLRNFRVIPTTGSGPSEALVIVRGAGNGVTLEHLQVSKENLSGSQEVIWWNQSSAHQGVGSNNAFIIRYNHLVGNNADALNRLFRHTISTGTTRDLQVYGNYAHDSGGTCFFIRPRGTGQTFLSDVHHNSLVNCGVESDPGDWLIYHNGARGHIHHNFGDCTDADGSSCASGWRHRSGGGLIEWNASFRMGVSTGAAGRGMSPFGSCNIQCNEPSTFRHNIVTAHPGAHTSSFCFNLAGDSTNTVNFYNNTCYGFGRATLTNNTSSTRTYNIKNNLFLQIGLGTGGFVIEEVSGVAGTFNYANNLYDWIGSSISAFYRQNGSINRSTIAAACAALGRFNCNNKGGVAVNDTRIVHNPTRDPTTADFTPTTLNSGALGFTAMLDGESAHRTGWGDGSIAGIGPIVHGRMHIGAVGNGFPCVGAVDLARAQRAGENGLPTEPPTYKCGALLE